MLGAEVLRLEVNSPVDTVVAVNVLDRVHEDVAALRSMAGAALPGGRLLLVVPAHPGLAGAYDQALEQRRRYSTEALRSAVEAAGLVAEVVRPVNLLGGLAWWAAVRVGRQARPTPSWSASTTGWSFPPSACWRAASSPLRPVDPLRRPGPRGRLPAAADVGARHLGRRPVADLDLLHPVAPPKHQ